jgi:hypothetical protein
MGTQSLYALFLSGRLRRRSIAVPPPIYVQNLSTLVRHLYREDGIVYPSKMLVTICQDIRRHILRATNFQTEISSFPGLHAIKKWDVS